jgi:hypothetical protein
MKAPTWSFSRLLVFEQCPYHYKLQHLDRIPDLQPKTAADRGTAIHQEAEDYVTGKSPITHNLRHFVPDLTALAKHHNQGRVICEEEWGFDHNWAPCEWKLAWLRLKCDAVCWLAQNHLVVVDYKGLERSTLIPTPTGWTTMGEIRVGEELFASDGSICKVTGKSEVKHLSCYRITFDDASTVICDEEHLWALDDGQIVPVTELTKYDRINTAKPIQLPEQELPIEPYIFGLWLAEGNKKSAEITNGDDFIWSEIERLGYKLGVNQNRNTNRNCRTHTIRDIRQHLLDLDVFWNKHIPEIYMRSSFEQRLALLQGIMDGDGHANKTRNQVVLQSADPNLSKQYLELILSLGQRATRTECKTFCHNFIGKAYPVSFRPNGIMPFRLPRKVEIAKNFGPGRSGFRRITSVENVPSVETQCIAVDSTDRTFLCTEHFIPTHNTGKRFGNEIKHARQLQLYALCALIRYPNIEQVTCELWYLDQNELASFTMHRKQLSKYLKTFDRDGRSVTECQRFDPRPNLDSCRYCPYHADRQGECAYGVTAMGKNAAPQPVRKMVLAKPSKFDSLFAEEATHLIEAFK